jgi:hypothetical protein
VLISLPLFPSNSKYLISEIGGAKLVRLNYSIIKEFYMYDSKS